MSVLPRLNRLFGDDGNCFDVAIDHGLFNERSFLNGIESASAAILTVLHAAPDAIQLGPGLAPLLQNLPGRSKPALVLRTDIANCYGASLPSHLFSELIAQPLEQALRLDASCVVVNLLFLPGQPELHRDCIRSINRLKPECERYGMPLMIEPLVMRSNDSSGGYQVDGTIDLILPLVRQAVELGADIIKADPTSELSEYHRVVEVAGRIPVLVRGGGKAGDVELLARTESLMQQGARGIVYGRNVVQHSNPVEIVQRLMGIVHRSFEDA